MSSGPLTVKSRSYLHIWCHDLSFVVQPRDRNQSSRIKELLLIMRSQDDGLKLIQRKVSLFAQFAKSVIEEGAAPLTKAVHGEQNLS